MANIKETTEKVKEAVTKINEEHPGIWREALTAGIVGTICCAIGMLIGVNRGYKYGLANGYLCGLFMTKGESK